MTTARERIRERPTTVAALFVFGLGLTAAILDLGTIAALSFTVGLLVVVPLVYLLFAPSDDDEDIFEDPPDPIEELRHQYANGTIGHEEFERRLDRLIETEGLEATEEDRNADRVREREILRERE